MTLRLAYSPCPNDTFIFDALVHGKVDTEGLAFEVIYEDIKDLNRLAREGAVHVCKVSFFAYYWLQHEWALLESGAALGQNCGPLLVSKAPLSHAALAQARIAIPGADTTANLLLQHYAPHAQQRQVLLFSDIMPAVAEGRFDAGLIIHESRFTYPSYGLQLVQDLGEYWEQSTGHAIPLGGIVAQKSLGAEVIGKLNRALARSVAYAHAHPTEAMPYVKQHAQEMDEAVMQQHIALYVNGYTRALGEKGHAAVQHLLGVAEKMQALAP